jgi:hypothetical protein
MARILIYCGLCLLAAGLLWPWLRQIPLGRLPGDLVFGKEHFRFYLPLTSSILVSLLLSLLFYLFRK